MFSFLKNKKDQYLLRVASILHKNIGSIMSLENAYNLAEECLNELRSNIAKGMFQDGSNPKETIMAYYSMCSMLRETSSADDKMTVFNLFIMAGVLKKELELGAFENMTSLEKGILKFGESVLADGISAPSKDDIATIKSNSVKIIMDIMKDQEVVALEQDVKEIVDNVSSNVGDREVSKVGEIILAVSVLSNATGYYIDQGKNDIAGSYFLCLGEANRKYFKGQMESYNDHQLSAWRAIMEDYSSLGKELMTN